MSKNSINRRDFLSSATLLGAAGTIGAGTFISSCDGSSNKSALVALRPESEWNIPKEVLPDKARDGVPLKAGIVGCGGRGSGAARNFLDAGPNLSITALCDTFPERVETLRKTLKADYNQNIPDNMCFSGIEGYKRLIDSGVDCVLLTMPPGFRAQHFKYAVNAGKHVFMEKPAGVDPVSIRSVIADSRKALQQGLCVITGTQRHHQRCYIESYKQVQSGMIGEIVSGNVYWNGSAPWAFQAKDPKMTDMEWMIRNWFNWTWLSGDHIVEQHIHNLDIFNWFSGKRPQKARAFGARHRRKSGDQYDMFCVDYNFEGDVNLTSMCRQIEGCSTLVQEIIKGTKGIWYGGDTWGCPDPQRIVDHNGNLLWRYDFEKEKQEFKQTAAMVLEHVNWVNHIRDKKPISQAEETAISTLTAIMGRMSAYTGQDVTWEEAMNSPLSIVLEDLSFRNMDLSQFTIPVPGKST
jgi:predicted dehydrogenase